MIHPRDSEKAKADGWGLLMSQGSGWLGKQFFRRLSDQELRYIHQYPNAACVGVNAGRAHRELRRRRELIAQGRRR